MAMTGKERMMIAVKKGKPDRLPVTIHQWQEYHLKKYMKTADEIDAFKLTGLDAAVTPWHGTFALADSPDWRYRIEEKGDRNGQFIKRHTVTTPEGDLAWETGTNPYTTFNTEHIIKTKKDAELFLKYLPPTKLDKKKITWWYDRTGDLGIVRHVVCPFAQPGSWQEFCELAGTQEAIMFAMEDPEFVHFFLRGITAYKVDYVHREMPGAKIDLIEHGGGSASSSVISPAMFDEFCVPYDKQVIDALHDIGLPVVYHTCGAIMAILEHIPANGCDASETCSPPGVGGDVGAVDRAIVKQVLGSKVSLIGGIDQSNTLEQGTPQDVRREVRACFETLGAGGGYICSASDHFFNAPVENLKTMARAARECVY
jgi:hypothetical protein